MVSGDGKSKCNCAGHAYSRALRRLRDLHRAEFDRIYQEEKAR